jgi:hypothetical protein
MTVPADALPQNFKERGWKVFVQLAEFGATRLRGMASEDSVLFWLDRLKAESPNFTVDSWHTGYFDGTVLITCPSGRIDKLFEASADLCLGIAVKQPVYDRCLVKAGRARLADAKRAPAVAERAAKRQAAVMPILKSKRWKRGRLVTESGVGKATVYGYLDGTRSRIDAANHKAMAEALEVADDQLPQ